MDVAAFRLEVVNAPVVLFISKANGVSMLLPTEVNVAGVLVVAEEKRVRGVRVTHAGITTDGEAVGGEARLEQRAAVRAGDAFGKTKVIAADVIEV